MANNPNILFKRGLHSALATAPVIDGAFYLTTDSHRLYAGIGDKLVDLNQYIQVVKTAEGATNSLAALQNVQEGDFAYIQTGNILAIYQNGGWIQINKNTNTTNATIAFTGDNKTDPGALTITLTDSDNKPITDTINFVGTQGNDITVDADGNVTVQGCIYTASGTAKVVSDKVVSYDFNITPSDDEVAASKVTLAAGPNITFTDKGSNTLEISTHDATQLTSVDVGVSGEDITVTVGDSTGKSVTKTLEDAFYVTYGKDGSSRGSNQGKLNVYTISEVDKLFNNLNGLTYKGTVASLAALKGITSPKAGDIYMASAGFAINDAIINITPGTTPSAGVPNDGQCEIGDLFIATGTETNGVITTGLKWTYVPSGNDIDTTYRSVVDITNHKISIVNNVNNDVIGVIDVNSGSTGKITLASNTNKNQDEWNLTLDHATVDRKDTKETTTEHNKAVTAVTGVSTDTTGHITGVTTKTFGIMEYALSGATVASSTANVATITDTLTASNGDAKGTSAFSIDTTAKDNLNVTVSGTSVKFALEWGTF